MAAEGLGSWRDEVDSPTSTSVAKMLLRAREADGVAAVSEQTELSLHATTTARHLCWHTGHGVIGYANLVPAQRDHPSMAEVVVDPAARGGGIGTTLVREALRAGGRDTRVWAHSDLPAAQAVAYRLHLRKARELWQMRRTLTDVVGADISENQNVHLRTYQGPQDDAELLRVNNAAFAWHPEQGGWDETQLRQRRAAEWFDPRGLFLAFSASRPERLLGFHWTKVHTDQSPHVGEVYVVAVDPAAQGAGLGRLLTAVGLRYLRDQGLSEVMLYTEADNLAAVRTYRGLGFVTGHIDVAYAADHGAPPHEM